MLNKAVRIDAAVHNIECDAWPGLSTISHAIDHRAGAPSSETPDSTARRLEQGGVHR